MHLLFSNISYFKLEGKIVQSRFFTFASDALLYCFTSQSVIKFVTKQTRTYSHFVSLIITALCVLFATQRKHVQTRALHSHPKFKTLAHCEAVCDQSKMCELPLQASEQV